MFSSFGFRFLSIACLALTLSHTGVALPTQKEGTFVGRATYFYVGLGSCGKYNVDSDYIVALSPSTYARGIHCGQRISITNPATGATATAIVEDTCPGCGPLDLDMSPALFSHFAPLSQGVFPVKWNFQ